MSRPAGAQRSPQHRADPSNPPRAGERASRSVTHHEQSEALKVGGGGAPAAVAWNEHAGREGRRESGSEERKEGRKGGREGGKEGSGARTPRPRAAARGRCRRCPRSQRGRWGSFPAGSAMSLPPEKASELKQIIHQQLLKVGLAPRPGAGETSPGPQGAVPGPVPVSPAAAAPAEAVAACAAAPAPRFVFPTCRCFPGAALSLSCCFFERGS